jgi:membrane protein YqaA with SNARE-associated domain
MLRRFYNWTMSLAGHRNAVPALATVSFIESSIFPIPPDVMLIPMVLADRTKAFRLAFICTVSSVLGGLLGYGIGVFLFEEIGRPLLKFYGFAPMFAEFQIKYNDWGAWAVFFGGVSPFPYKVITILSGVTALDIATFVSASIVARGLRFFLVAGLLWKFGDPIRNLIEKYMGLLFILISILLVGGFIAIKFFL